jgi:biotin transport system substrate-specific component
MQTLTLERSYMKDFCLVILASFAIGLAAHIAIPLWFTPVPLSTQNIVIISLSALLGSRRAFLATLAFLAQGAMGLPVFANGGAGLLAILGPTGGYLVGYLVASFVVGYLVERQKGLGFSFLMGHIAIFGCGAGYLASFVGMEKAILLGIAPFILGDILKTIVAVKSTQWIRSSY